MTTTEQTQMTLEQIRAELAAIKLYQSTCSIRCIGGSKFNRLSGRFNELRAMLRTMGV